MKKTVIALALLWLFICLIPMLCVRNWGIMWTNPKEEEIPPLIPPQGGGAEQETPFIFPDGDDSTTKVRVYMHETGEVEIMNMNDYLVGVLTAEMPASFEKEALKAQAVAARSYTLNKMAYIARNPSASSTHTNADVCTDSTHCKAYTSLSEAKTGWGADFEQNLNKIKECVAATDGEVAVYNNEPISAVFHAMSSGRTENARDVWGGEVPYLHSVESPGDPIAARFASSSVFSRENFMKIAQESLNITSALEPEKWIGESKFSEAGGVMEITLAGTVVSGRDIRSAYSLRSTHFELVYEKDQDRFTFFVKGHGHGVGMSQYGAQYMALSGSDYRDIIKWYYSGVEIIKLSDLS